MFPIPAQDKLNVVINSSDPAEQFHLKLYDITGKIVKDKNISHKYLMDLNGLPAGVYQLVISNTKSAVKKQRIVVE